MKKTITILPLLFALSVFSQDLPEANKKVLEYAKSKIGQRVGNGICSHLIDSALCQVNPDWYMRRYKSERNMYGKKVSEKHILPGDIFVRKTGSGHVAIVYSVNKDGSVVVLNQNVQDVSDRHWTTMKKSKVVFLTYSKKDGELKNVRFYRPY